ncbi:hypothetical protein L3Q82_015393 [Scortum barcoo]|uniref:Uncharacterized protein n=1 Tax=Scortum barcoo TaxID=214431 RepID=A0ACB8VU26_9TELE|nr:hypothetical protein L3Q82_015393 [Scortum barcoo]
MFIEVMEERRALAKLSTIMDNTSHPLHQTVGALSSSFSNRLRHPRCRKELPQIPQGPSSQTPSDCSLAWWGHDLCLCCGEKVEWPRAPYEDI